MNISANLFTDQLFFAGIKWAFWRKWYTTTTMTESKPPEVGSFTIKSTSMVDQGQSGIGKDILVSCRGRQSTLIDWQLLHREKNFSTSENPFGQSNILVSRSSVFIHPRWPTKSSCDFVSQSNPSLVKVHRFYLSINKLDPWTIKLLVVDLVMFNLLRKKLSRRSALSHWLA